MAIVTPCPRSWQDLKTRRLRRQNQKLVAVPVPAPVGPLPLGFLPKQPPPSSVSPFSVLSGSFCHLSSSAFLPFTETPNPFLLAERTTAPSNINNHSMQRERRVQNRVSSITHHPSSCGFSGPNALQPAEHPSAEQSKTLPEV